MSNPSTYALQQLPILPVMYLSSNVSLSGEGTKTNPYTIPEYL